MLLVSFLFRSSSIHKGFCLIICFFLFNSCQTLQDKKDIPVEKPPPSEETQIKTYIPKVGLFISDGGKGTFSLIPILKFFQENQLQFDSIIGTGWGAWLGAYFAKNQNTDEVQWNLFKLQQRGVFEKKLFSNKKKQARIIQTNLRQTFSSRLNTKFACPAFNKKGNLQWLGNRNPAKAVLHCLNLLPETNFKFENINAWGSVFVAGQALNRLKESGMDVIVWLKGPLQCQLTDQKQTEEKRTYWLELSHQIKRIKPNPDTFVFEPPHFPVSNCTFSKGNTTTLNKYFISSMTQKFQKLEQTLNTLRQPLPLKNTENREL